MSAWNDAEYILQAAIADISVAGSVFIYVPFGGVVTEIMSVIDGVITLADAVITPKVNGTTMGSTLTIANAGSAAGIRDTLDIALMTAAAVVAKGDYIQLTTDGGSTDAVRAEFAIRIRR